MPDPDQFDDQLHDPYLYDNPELTDVSWQQQLRALSRPSMATILYLVALCLILVFSDWVFGAVTIVALAMAVVPLLFWWHSNRLSCPLDMVIRSFGMGCTFMFWSVLLVLFLAVLPLEQVIFNKWRMSDSLALNILDALVMRAAYVGVEELHKVVLARWSKRKLEWNRETKTHLIAYVATSAGYATSAAVACMLVLDPVLDAELGVRHDSLGDLGVAILALLTYSVFGTPLHVLSGYYIGLQTTNRTPFFKVALAPFLLRTLFTCQLFFWFAILSTVGLDSSPIAIGFGMLWSNALICWLMIVRIKRLEGSLPAEYLQHVGYLQAFGYGHLPGGEDEVEIPENVRQLV